jgi:hypothetical protein
MTEYGSRSPLTHTPTTTKKKENRRKLLDEVYARRKVTYPRFLQKLQQHRILDKIDLSFD